MAPIIWRERMRSKEELQRTEFLGEEKRSGGSRSVFRIANPLDDIRNSTRIETVVLNGRVCDRAELDAILALREAAVKAGLQ